MEPYLIICDSCASRLKVTNEALIGQRLACPKCQTMIKVVAPKGFKPSSAAQESEAAAEDSLSGNFEDIESLLAAAQQPERTTGKQPTARASAASQAANESPKANAKPIIPPPQPAKLSGSAVTSEPSTPMMPGADWDTESTKRKKQMLQVVMLALMALIGLGIGIWALIGNGGGESTDPTVAIKDEPKQGMVQDDSGSLPKFDPELKEQEDGKTNDVPTSASPTPITHPESVEEPAIDTQQPPASPSTLPPPSLVDNSAGKSAPPPLPLATGTEPPAAPKDPLPTQLLPPVDTPSTEDSASPDSRLIASTENSLGALSKILQGQGTSLKQIEDIAQIQKERALIGTPTYLIERPDNKPVRVDRQLAAELSGWKLDEVALIDAIGDLEMLSGIPVSIDPQLFRNGRVDILRPVSLQIEEVSFKDAFEMLLKNDGLVVQPTTSGLRITSAAAADVVTMSYPQSFCTNEKSTERLKDLIVAVTGINDWDDDAQYQLDVDNDSVTVSHFPKQQKLIADLLDKLNAAADYQRDPAAMKQKLRPMALQAEVALAAAPNLNKTNPYRRSMRIGSLLRSVRNVTGLKTIMDWDNLTKMGWFPNTRLPGRIDEPTNRELLNQLGHAMETTTVVIGPGTVMLTTFENAAKQRDIEVFSVGSIVDEKMKPSQLDQLITETMGVDQLTPPNATVIYFAECKCLVANAPQIIQRQLSLIVEELSSTANE